MAATVDPTLDLEVARRALDDLHSQIRNVAPWQPHDGRWWLRFELSPAGLNPDGPIAPVTAWCAVVDQQYPAGSIDIYPASEGGIVQTFAHQLPNDPGPDNQPWRTGKVCLVDAVRGHELAAARDEPLTTYERLVWHVWRTIGWVERASNDQLLAPGEPFELPVFGQFRNGPAIAFHEGSETFATWRASREFAGIADLVTVRDDSRAPTHAVVAWGDLLNRELVRPVWGYRIGRSNVLQRALWFRFDRLLVRPPWRAPQTWQDVHDFAAEQGIDFAAELRRATASVRDGKAHFVLLGFPVERVMGEQPSRYHWVAFVLPALTRDKRARTPVPGFRTKTAAWMVDRRDGPLAGDAPLEWVRAENWHPVELAARGRFTGALAGRPVALLGAGTLGSALGDLLVRAGVHDLAIFDASRLEAGNLARHELSILEHGMLKAEALASRLNTVSPNACVEGFGSEFPPTDANARVALERAHVVIDTTASDRVAVQLAAFPWGGEREFASVSFSFGAERLYLYLARGESFPLAHFRAALQPWIDADTRPPADFPHEGIGCWSSVFPARADDVTLAAAVAARQLDERLGSNIDGPELTVFTRLQNGGISTLDTPVRG